jgi:hypothetical protein
MARWPDRVAAWRAWRGVANPALAQSNRTREPPARGRTPGVAEPAPDSTGRRRTMPCRAILRRPGSATSKCAAVALTHKDAAPGRQCGDQAPRCRGCVWSRPRAARLEVNLCRSVPHRPALPAGTTPHGRPGSGRALAATSIALSPPLEPPDDDLTMPSAAPTRPYARANDRAVASAQHLRGAHADGATAVRSRRTSSTGLAAPTPTAAPSPPGSSQPPRWAPWAHRRWLAA